MLQNGEWELVIANDTSDDCNLVAELNRGDIMLTFITGTGTGDQRKIRWYKTDENIDIPFDWFLEAMKVADSRIS